MLALLQLEYTLAKERLVHARGEDIMRVQAEALAYNKLHSTLTRKDIQSGKDE